MQEVADQIVERGMALLDEKCGPGWEERIPDNATVASSTHCFACLATKRYSFALAKHFLGIGDSTSYGFSPSDDIFCEDIDDVWHRKLAVRRLLDDVNSEGTRTAKAEELAVA